jgi:hypothetical protein
MSGGRAYRRARLVVVVRNGTQVARDQARFVVLR